MKFLYDLIVSPFGLPINPVHEYIILAIVGGMAFLLAYRLAGRFGTDSSERKVLHWTFRIIIFIALWAIIRGVIWLYKNPLYAAIVFGCIVLFAIGIGIVLFIRRHKQKNSKDTE